MSNLDKKLCRIREYVDVIQSQDLHSAVRNLLYKLKELYFIRKTKPQKGKFKKVNAPPKKRYMIGLKEIQKNLCAKKLSMVIIATNIEKVEGLNGLDEYIYQIVQECYKQQLPLVFTLTRSQLGNITKFKGQKASIVGVFNF
jgi:ribosomal protein L7Ae-like RNA K-turn-binding protein